MADSGIVRCVLEEQVFQGEGRKKADAKRDAAANALSFLQEQPIWEAQHRPPPLPDVLNACFTNKVRPARQLHRTWYHQVVAELASYGVCRSDPCNSDVSSDSVAQRHSGVCLLIVMTQDLEQTTCSTSPMGCA